VALKYCSIKSGTQVLLNQEWHSSIAQSSILIAVPAMLIRGSATYSRRTGASCSHREQQENEMLL
jgi:hypothetical protein